MKWEFRTSSLPAMALIVVLTLSGCSQSSVQSNVQTPKSTSVEHSAAPAALPAAATLPAAKGPEAAWADGPAAQVAKREAAWAATLRARMARYQRDVAAGTVEAVGPPNQAIVMSVATSTTVP